MIWKTAVPPGHSSPVLTDRHVFLTALDDGKLATLCLDRATGRILWTRHLPRTRQEKQHKLNHPASASAVTDGRNVYVFFGEFGLAAYTVDGKELWRTPMGPFTNIYGMGASPILAAGGVVVMCDQGKDSFIAAFDGRNGRERWRVARPDAISGHSTPVVWERREIVAPGSYKLDAYDAETGRTAWSFDGLPSEMKSVPVIAGDTIFIHGFNTPENDRGKMPAIPPFPGPFRVEQSPTEHVRRYFKFLDVDGNGVMDAAEWASYERNMKAENAMVAVKRGGKLAWKFPRSIPQLPSPLLYRGVLYMINESGVLTLLDPETGAAHEQTRLRGAADQYYASPVAAGGMVFVTSFTGVVTVLRAGAKQEVLAANELEEECMATPAIEGGSVYVRTKSALYRFGSARR